MRLENPPSPLNKSKLRLSLGTIIEEWNNEVESANDDEKVTIYRLQTKQPLPQSMSGHPNSQSEEQEVFQQIRVKHIEYLEKKAIAVYFTNVSHHVKQLRLEKDVVTEQNRVESLESYTSTISHEFRTPLATCLTFLDILIKMDLPPQCIHMLKLIIAQLNLLICLVNDVLDLKLIERGQFE